MTDTAQINCCQTLESRVPTISPFNEIVSFGYYDGTTAGIARCSHCKRCYRYEMAEWDSEQDVRVYSLASLTEEAFRSIVGLRSAAFAGVPRHAQIFTEAQNQQIDEELAKADLPANVIASAHFQTEVLAFRSISDAARQMLPSGKSPYPGGESKWAFWKEFLSL